LNQWKTSEQGNAKLKNCTKMAETSKKCGKSDDEVVEQL
jgi:hypothetical protein